jgi:hypothetical protein
MFKQQNQRPGKKSSDSYPTESPLVGWRSGLDPGRLGVPQIVASSVTAKKSEEIQPSNPCERETVIKDKYYREVVKGTFGIQRSS